MDSFFNHLFGILTTAFVAFHFVILGRVMMRPARDPAARLAWGITIIAVPVVGVVGYLLLGEARISARRRARFAAIERMLPHPDGDPEAARIIATSGYDAPFALARSVNGLPPTLFNRAVLADDSNAAIDAMVEDIDDARETVHLNFYIWLADGNGLKVKDALIRAAQRGVKVRALADALGSRTFHRSHHWTDLQAAGVDARVALPVGGVLWTLIRGRVDLRNHRKVLVIDNAVAWCGSQNLADPEFRVKPHYAPWVDIMTRWEGPVARHCQFLFAADWMGEFGDDIAHMLGSTGGRAAAGGGGIVAQVIGTGPLQNFPAMTSCFAELVHAARHELVITTPYFVPDEQLLFALIAAARRGVRVVLILPARNDSRIVAAASRSTYPDLLRAGVELYHYPEGLLHAKTMIADGEVGLIGSANLDRRSFELNFENNILFADPDLAGEIRARQDDWLGCSRRVSTTEVAAYSPLARLWQNMLAMFSPVL